MPSLPADLFNTQPKDTFQNLVQINTSSNQFLDGRGNVFQSFADNTALVVSSQTASIILPIYILKAGDNVNGDLVFQTAASTTFANSSNGIRFLGSVATPLAAFSLPDDQTLKLVVSSSTFNFTNGNLMAATASWALNAVKAITASFALTASFAITNNVTQSVISSSFAISASWASSSLSSSQAQSSYSASVNPGSTGLGAFHPFVVLNTLGTSGSLPLYSTSDLYYNAHTSTLIGGTASFQYYVGVDSASLSKTASSVNVTDDNNNLFRPVVFIAGPAGTNNILDDPSFVFNPSSNQLSGSSLGITASLNGTSSWGVNASNINVTVDNTSTFRPLVFVAGAGATAPLDDPAFSFNPATNQLSGSSLGITASLFGTASWAQNSVNAGSSNTVVKRLNTLFSTSTNVNTNTNLSFPVLANSSWVATAKLSTNSPNNNYAYQISAPAGTTMEGWITNLGNPTAVQNWQQTGGVNTLLGPIGTVNALNNDLIQFSVKVGATPGTIAIGVASEVNTQTTTVGTGSYLIANLATDV